MLCVRLIRCSSSIISGRRPCLYTHSRPEVGDWLPPAVCPCPQWSHCWPGSSPCGCEGQRWRCQRSECPHCPADPLRCVSRCRRQGGIPGCRWRRWGWPTCCRRGTGSPCWGRECGSQTAVLDQVAETRERLSEQGLRGFRLYGMKSSKPRYNEQRLHSFNIIMWNKSLKPRCKTSETIKWERTPRTQIVWNTIMNTSLLPPKQQQQRQQQNYSSLMHAICQRELFGW